MSACKEGVCDECDGADTNHERMLEARVAELEARLSIVRKHASGNCFHHEMQTDACLDAILEAVDAADIAATDGNGLDRVFGIAPELPEPCADCGEASCECCERCADDVPCDRHGTPTASVSGPLLPDRAAIALRQLRFDDGADGAPEGRRGGRGSDG